MVCVKAIQIITPENHMLALQLHDFHHILEADDIKDRHVSIVSIAGAFRKGKSFLLNFFLKYLYAQYKRHDVTDWIGGCGNGDEMVGFISRGGRKPETTGIWMWSEIFTHDYEDGNKVAIILLDTQGLFDNQSTTKDCTATFAISMMLSSVQCYNVMQNIQEDHLQHLELFTEYARLAMQHTTEKPFQKLLFIIRDWQCDEEFDYGNGQKVVDEFLDETEFQTIEMHQMRQRLKSSFEHIGAYLLPYPGKTVANGRLMTIFNWLGLRDPLQMDIEPEFIDTLKLIVPLIFAPENLVLKKINGEKIRASDLLTYLPTYVNIFNNGRLPDPKSVLMSTAAADHMLLYNKCLNYYTKSVQSYLQEKSNDRNAPFFTPLEFQSHHQEIYDESMHQFDNKPKLGGQQLTAEFKSQLINDIGTKYEHFTQENERMKTNFNILAKEKMNTLVVDCIKLYVESMKGSFCDVDSFYSESELQQISDDALHKSMSKFEMHPKIGGDELVDMFLDKLRDGAKLQFLYIERDNDKKRRFFEDLENKTEEAAALAKIQARADAAETAAATAKADMHNINLYNKCLTVYKNAMDNALYRKFDGCYEPNDLQQIHDKARQKSLELFREKFENGGQEIMLEPRLESEIDTNYINFQHKNEWKRKEIQDAKEKADIKEKYDEMLAKFNKMEEDEGTCTIL